MEITVRLGSTNTSNLEASALRRTIHAWNGVAAFFAEPHKKPLLVHRAPDQWYEVSLDASAMLRSLDEDLADEEEREARPLKPLEAHEIQAFTASTRASSTIVQPNWHNTIAVALTPCASAEKVQIPWPLLGRFLEQLFVAMNLAVPASCNLSFGQHIGFERSEPPELNSDIIDNAYYDASQLGWPSLRHLPFAACWDWLHRGMAYDIDVARTPTEKALFLLLRLCRRSPQDPDNLLLLTQAFESVLDIGKAGGKKRSLEMRLEAVLGRMDLYPKWCRDLYRRRSEIIHGSALILRPGNTSILPYLMGETSPMLNQAAILESTGVAVLLALLQDLVVHDAQGYEFGETVLRTPWSSRR